MAPPWEIFLGLGILFATCGLLLPVFGLRLGAIIGIVCCIVFYAEGRHYLNTLGIGKNNKPILQKIRSKFTDQNDKKPVKRSLRSGVTSLTEFRNRKNDLSPTPPLPRKSPDDDPPPPKAA